MISQQIALLYDALGIAVVESVKQQLLLIDIIDPKTSNIYQDVTYRYDGKSLYLVLNDYYVFIEAGRKPNLKPPPVSVILAWMVRKRIGNSNRVAFLIARAIGRRGIKPKPFLDTAIAQIDLSFIEKALIDLINVIITK